ncbi:FxLYD domain-containing protein [Achromobacter seleniivolatilans]|uniref:FxLYD domain-containing protein n=1 Tax=Achromobacter seleniivolatilans TaxID=3047478 RepID=A0ABY9M248_9BURK|nr:FxLYD domain-containing protein [Achromobacter sp. R39]WMD21081.1 FxLYD domain-containing protein [Achromobacter sp. R39]
MKADRPGSKPLAWPAKAALVLVILAAAGFAAAKYTGLLSALNLSTSPDLPARAADAQPSAAAQAQAPKDPAQASRIIRVNPAETRVIDNVRLSTAELLDPAFALFDPKNLKLSAPRRLLDEIERPVLYAELVNNSDSYVALSPRAEISVFDGSRKLNLRQNWSLPTHLYPGERVPVALTGGDFDRFTEVKTDWLPAKRAALPGPRPKLAVTVENTEAAIGTGTLNFTYRYRYKYVTVHGRVRNDDKAEVGEVRVWVSLYDAQDKLSGASFQELRLPKLQPGESAPFELNVKQYGGNFAKVGVVYDAKPL